MKTGMVFGTSTDGRCEQRTKDRARARSYFGYIVERGSSLHFRISVPRSLRQTIGKAEFRLSLGAIPYTEARPKAYLLASRSRMLFKFIAKRMKEGLELDRNKLSATMHRLLDWHLWFSESSIAEMYNGNDKEYIVRDLSEQSVEYADKIYTSNELDGFSMFDHVYFSVENSKRSDLDLKKESVPSIAGGLGCDHGLASDLFDTFEDEIRTDESEFNADVYTARGFVDRVSSIAYKHTANKVDGTFDIKEAHAELDRYFPLSGEVQSQRDECVSSTMVALPQVANTVTSMLTLGEAVDKFIDKLDRSAGKKNNQHGAKFKRRGLMELSLIIGRDVPVSCVTIDMLDAYADKLRCIPVRLDIDEIDYDINEYGVSRNGKSVLSAKTISKRLTDTGTFVDWLYGNKYIDRDSYDSLRKIVRGGVRECKDRVKKEGGSPTRPYSMEEISILFGVDAYFKWTKNRADYFWPPILALYTGMRMGEIMTLRCKDIKRTPELLDYHVESKTKPRHNQADGLYYIDLTTIVEKRLKDDGGASHRPVPIHPFLIELGFLDYVNRFKREEFIFAKGLAVNAKSNGEYCKQFKNQYKLTDRFREYRMSLGIGRMDGDREGDMLTFHCFRNTVIAKMKDSYVHPELRCEITGHIEGEDGTSKNKSHSGYGDKFSVEQKLRDGIMKLDFHEKIPDLNLLAQSKWAKG